MVARNMHAASDSDRPHDHGAPPSLSLQSQRTAEQEALVMTVKQFEREAGRLVAELESRNIMNRQCLYAGESLLAAAIMLLNRSITRERVF